MKIIKNVKLKIDEKEVLRYQSYYHYNAKKTNKTIMQITREEITQGYKLVKPQGIYSPIKIKKIFFSERRVDLENDFSLFFNNSAINFLKETDHLVFGIVTIGNILEDKIFEFFTHKEYSRGWALDAVGTVAIRYLSQYIMNMVCQEAKKQHLQTTKHFIPGTLEWDISQQANIFQIIPTDKIGVKLTESYMMVPKKSLSWVMGLGKNIIIAYKDDNSCQICQAINCQFRKVFNVS